MRKLGALPFAAILFVASAASAQQPVPATPSAEPNEAAAKPTPIEKPICRSEETTGSRFSKKVCRTKAEWNAMAADGAAALEANRRPR
ncbi:hypothetical protein O6V14_18035 [Sphingomonas faeni]